MLSFDNTNGEGKNIFGDGGAVSFDKGIENFTGISTLVDNKQINLGVVQPGERIANFGDALRRLANQAKFMHSDLGRYWYSMSPSINRTASDRAGQLEQALVQVEIDKSLISYINGLSDRGQFESVQVAPGNSSEVPDELGGVRAVILGVEKPYNSRGNSKAMEEINDIFLQRGNTPRVYRNTLIFIAADERHLENLELAMRSSIAWNEVVRDAESGRLNLRSSDIALAKSKANEAIDTTLVRLKEAWSYVIYPYQENPQSDVVFTSSKVAAQDGILVRSSKKLVNDAALLVEIGPDNLNRHLLKFIWNEQDHIFLSDIWKYLNRYCYLPRLKDRQTLIKAIQSSVGQTIPGPFAYAERYSNESKKYYGLVIEASPSASIVIDNEAVIVDPKIANSNRSDTTSTPESDANTGDVLSPTTVEKDPTNFYGTVFLSSDRPSRDMTQIVEGIIQQLTTLPEADVTIKLEIDAEVKSGLNKAKVRTILENAQTLNFSDKSVK